MASDLSILGRMTTAVTPKSNRQRSYLVTQNEDILAIANKVYGNKRYDPAGWRRIMAANGIENPFTFSDQNAEGNLVGKTIIIPPAPLPDSFSE